MNRFLVRRILLAVLTLFGVSVFSFLMFFTLPRDPVTAMCPKNCNAERLARVRTDLGLNKPKVDQYVDYMKGIFVGRDLGSAQGGHCPAPCLGYSFTRSERVTDTMARVIPVTLSIVIPAAILWFGLGLGLGMLSAVRRGTVFDRAAIGFALTGASLQIYFVGGLLLSLFVYNLKWLPSPHYVSIFNDPWQWFQAMVLPWIALAFLFCAIYARLTRAQMLETLSEDYIRTARAKGLANRTVHRRHALRATITPLITIFGLDVGAALGGTFITETTFGLNGLGRTTVQAVRDGDLPTVMATVLISATFIIVANIVVDLVYAIIDPRVRLT
jgi:peptide/nickel transport system permease protein